MATVIIGPTGNERSVTAREFLPGLIVHKSLGDSSLYAITLEAYGLFILDGVREEDLAPLKTLLSEMDWTLTDTAIATSIEHVKLIEMDASQKQEARIAKDFGGKTQPASGSRWGFKRDAVTPELLFEAKTTISKSYTLQVRDLQFLKEQAFTQGKIPAYSIEFQKRVEVVFAPLGEFGEDMLPGTKLTLNRFKNKTIKLRDTDVELAVDGGALVLATAAGLWVGLEYEFFLELAKRGLT